MLNWNSIDDNRQRQAMLRRQADRSRLAAQARQATTVYPPLRPVIAWAGRRLITLGYALLVHAREWDYRSNTVYNGAKSSAQVL